MSASAEAWTGPTLVCPRDGGALEREGGVLGCARGHRYPLVAGVPVMLCEEDLPAIDVAGRSLRAAWAALERPSDDALFVETLGIAEHEKRGVRELAARGGGVDPVAAHLVAATSGLAYVSVVGKLEDYPIPSLRLPAGGGRRLLDVGCSWGRWSIAAARAGYRVVGIDPSLGAVLAARRVCVQLGLEASFCVADARALPFEAASFEEAFSYSVLQHMAEDDVRRVLVQLRRVLAPGGRATIQMANALGVRSLYHQARRGFREPQGFEVRYRSPRALRHLFETHLGPTELSVDCYFGLGLQPSDAPLLRPTARTAVLVSESLRRIGRRVPRLREVADSVYLTVHKAGAD